MTLKEAIKFRESIRTYKEEPLNIQDYKKVVDYCNSISSGNDVHFQVVKNDASIFSKFRKSYGLFKNVNHYIVCTGNKHNPYRDELSGYLGIKLSLYLTSNGIGNCFIGGTYDQKAISYQNYTDDEVIYVMSIGYPKAKEQFVGELVRKMLRRHHRAENYFMITKEVTPDWIMEGLTALTFSPSAKNRQGIKLRYQDGQLYIDNVVLGVYDMVDLGIAKALFEIATDKGKFDQGDHALFHLRKEVQTSEM